MKFRDFAGTLGQDYVCGSEVTQRISDLILFHEYVNYVDDELLLWDDCNERLLDRVITCGIHSDYFAVIAYIFCATRRDPETALIVLGRHLDYAPMCDSLKALIKPDLLKPFLMELIMSETMPEAHVPPICNPLAASLVVAPILHEQKERRGIEIDWFLSRMPELRLNGIKNIYEVICQYSYPEDFIKKMKPIGVDMIELYNTLLSDECEDFIKKHGVIPVNLN